MPDNKPTVFTADAARRIVRAAHEIERQIGANSQRTRQWPIDDTLPGVFPVRVIMVGGIDGSPTTKATWIYDVYDLDGTNRIAQNWPLSRPRPYGSMVYQTASISYGLAFYNSNGDLILWDAGEVPDTYYCVTP